MEFPAKRGVPAILQAGKGGGLSVALPSGFHGFHVGHHLYCGARWRPAEDDAPVAVGSIALLSPVTVRHTQRQDEGHCSSSVLGHEHPAWRTGGAVRRRLPGLFSSNEHGG